MSTRCQIQIEGNTAIIYQHSDGYPEAVLPDVMPFVATFFKSRGNDPEYLAARLIQHMTNLADKQRAEFQKTLGSPHTDRGPDFTGYGVSAELHGDIEFLYTVKQNGSVLVQKARHGEAGATIAEFQLGMNPDDAVAEIKRLQGE